MKSSPQENGGKAGSNLPGLGDPKFPIISGGGGRVSLMGDLKFSLLLGGAEDKICFLTKFVSLFQLKFYCSIECIFFFTVVP